MPELDDTDQKSKNNRLLVFSVVYAFAFVIGLAFVMNAFLPMPRSVNAEKITFFVFWASGVLAVSGLLHLFYFSWLSGAPVNRFPVVAFKRLLYMTVAWHLLGVVLAPAGFMWIIRLVEFGIFVQAGVLIVASIFLAGGFFLLGTRLFSPVFSGCHFGWRLPVLMLGGGGAWCLGFVGLMTAFIGK